MSIATSLIPSKKLAKILAFCLLPVVSCLLPVARASEVDAANRVAPTPPANPSTQPSYTRLRPNFSEEERRQRFYQKGFGDTFLNDSLNGVSDLLGGGDSGGAFAGNNGLSPITPDERGIIQQQPSFDPTDVIIPRSGGRR